jgi:hypothetical protein
MEILFIILALSVAALLATAGVLWLRVRWTLRRSDEALKNTLVALDAEREPVEKT